MAEDHVRHCPGLKVCQTAFGSRCYELFCKKLLFGTELPPLKRYTVNVHVTLKPLQQDIQKRGWAAMYHLQLYKRLATYPTC